MLIFTANLKIGLESETIILLTYFFHQCYESIELLGRFFCSLHDEIVQNLFAVLFA